jgi:hypothetical protein
VKDRWAKNTPYLFFLPEQGRLIYDTTSKFYVKLGDYNTQDPFDGQETFNVAHIIIHPSFSYDEDFAFNDVALLWLASPANLSPRIGPICLPFSSGKKKLRSV